MKRTLLLIVGALALASWGSGCSTLSPHWDTSQLEELPSAEETQLPQASAQNQQQGKYTVELRALRADRELVEVPFSGVPYVQHALEKSGAIEKFNRMNVEIIRNTGGHHQKMRSSYDHSRNQVPIEWDYALYPGDRIIVTESSRTMFDDMLESALGPLAFMGR